MCNAPKFASENLYLIKKSYLVEKEMKQFTTEEVKKKAIQSCHAA